MARTAVTTLPGEKGPRTITDLREELERAELELSIAEARTTQRFLTHLTEYDNFVLDTERAEGWQMVSSGGSLVQAKSGWWVSGMVQDPGIMRRESYRAWRMNPHAKGLLRSLVKFIIGRQFEVDFQETRRGVWTDRTKTKIKQTAEPKMEPDGTVDLELVNNPSIARLVFDEFYKRNNFLQRGKEIVLRTFRDGECFVRNFAANGRVTMRFIEPDNIASEPNAPGSMVDVTHPDGTVTQERTVVEQGIEYLERDIETVVFYHVKYKANGKDVVERVPAAEIEHIKCNADSNDLRGVPFLEAVFKKLTQYEQWEDYRITLNKVRTAVALVRHIEGATAGQVNAMLAGRQPARSAPEGRDPQTTAGRRETMFTAGTVLTPSAGVKYEFLAPKLDATDAQHDGRRILLTIAAAAGLPEMLVTGDYSNANFASTDVAVRIAQREWEDWQDFFEPVFIRIIERVLLTAIESGLLPEDLDTDVFIQWPTIIQEEADKQTERREKLHTNGVLSKKTWAAQEGLTYEEERENIREEREAEALTNPQPEEDPNADPNAPDARTARVNAAQEALIALDELRESFAHATSVDELRESMDAYITTAKNFVLAEAGV